MSAVAKLEAALTADVEAVTKKRFIGTMEAALIADRHPETVREAARSGELHGTQREGVNPRTGKRFRSAQWKFRPACVEAWADGTSCEHQAEARRPVSLQDWRARPAGGRS